MTAYGRKQPFGLSLNRPSRMSALEKKADVQTSRAEPSVARKSRSRAPILAPVVPEKRLTEPYYTQAKPLI